jgi:hypothetical protein
VRTVSGRVGVVIGVVGGTALGLRDARPPKIYNGGTRRRIGS